MKASKVFKSRKITRHDAIKLAPLTKFWTKRIMKARVSDNGQVRMEGFIIGFVTCLIAAFIGVGL